MENKRRNKKSPLFAEVDLTENDVEQMAYSSNRRHRTPFIKLTYPNGVNLILPMDITPDRLEQFIRISL